MKRHRRLLIVLAIAAGVVIAGAGWITTRGLGSSDDRKSEAPPAEVKLVLAGYVDLEGGVVSLQPLQAGRVETLLIEEGQVVSPGTELLRLDDRLPRWKLEEAEAGLKAAEVKLAQAREGVMAHQSKIDMQKEGVDAAQKRLDDARDALGAGMVKQAETALRVERKKLATLEKIDPTLDVKLAEANIAARRAERDEAKFALDEMTLRAPADGTVLRINARVGDLIGPTAPEPAVLFGVGQKRIVRFHVEQEFADQTTIGASAELRDESNPGAGVWRGKIVRLGEAFLTTRTLAPPRLSLMADETRTLEGVIALEDGPPGLRLGQQMRVILRPK
ncbi:MAG: biotin/lipoyl-binding protein [Gemmataceae bacterium]